MDADEVQIDGNADVTMNTDNLVVGGSGDLKGTITSHNADVWGKLDGEVKVGGTLTIQEQGSVSGSIEYENLQIKLGGKIKGDVKVSEKIKKIDDIKNINKEESLDNPITPVAHIFVKDKDPWIDIVNKTICFDKMYDRENTWSKESLERLESKTKD